MHIEVRAHDRLSNPTDRGLAGFTIGLLHIEGTYPLLPGNPQNASTFDFPVLYEAVTGADPRRVLSGAPDLEPVVAAAARRLERAGVGAIVGVCGSFAYFQAALAAAVEVPVFSSVLVQAELVASTLPHGRKLLIVFADQASDTPRLREACGLRSHDRVVSTGCIDLPAFKDLVAGACSFDVSGFRAQLSARIAEALAREPAIGAVLLQCSELAPFAADIQAMADLPVHDGALLARWVHASLSRLPPHGFMTRGALGRPLA